MCGDDLLDDGEVVAPERVYEPHRQCEAFPCPGAVSLRDSKPPGFFATFFFDLALDRLDVGAYAQLAGAMSARQHGIGVQACPTGLVLHE